MCAVLLPQETSFMLAPTDIGANRDGRQFPLQWLSQFKLICYFSRHLATEIATATLVRSFAQFSERSILEFVYAPMKWLALDIWRYINVSNNNYSVLSDHYALNLTRRSSMERSQAIESHILHTIPVGRQGECGLFNLGGHQDLWLRNRTTYGDEPALDSAGA